MKIVLCRVDERLIHGQVMTSWVGETGAKRIAIVDDSLYNDDFMKQVLILAAPPSIKIRVLDVKGFKEMDERSKDDKKVIVLFKHPKYVLDVLKLGIKLDEITIGNLGPNATREKVTKNVYVNAEEREILNEIEKFGCKIYIQMLPNDEKKSFD